jgi:penicillin amidase
VLVVLLAGAAGGGVALVLLAWSMLAGSLPELDGGYSVEGLDGEVVIQRDEQGIPTIRARTRADLALGTGFVHAQDRFFQMDLLRRRAAGELCELAGPAPLALDRAARIHRFRARARRRLLTLSGAERELLEAYTRGVNAGLGSLRKPPFEYLLLRSRPAPWGEEDTLLVALGMFPILQWLGVEHEQATGVLYDTLPVSLADFLSPLGSVWDAPLAGLPLPAPPLPGPEVLDLRLLPEGWEPPGPRRVSWLPREAPRAGSNQWAVSGRRSVHGRAMVANDMHLGLMVPGLWYRASLVLQASSGREPPVGRETKTKRITGVTLPGTPAMVAGSMGRVAWGFTNTEGDFADLVVLEPHPDDPDLYRTPAGWKQLECFPEVIQVRGADDVPFKVESTIWGPVLDRDHLGRRRALRWVAHDPDTINFDLMRLEEARDVHEAIRLTSRAGLPGQNVVFADTQGNIAWTVIGRFPRRVGFDGRRPTSWADGSRRWAGWLRAEDRPRIVNPPEGILWSANNRTVGEPYLSRIGLANYDHGARAKQIRDDLRTKALLSEADMLDIQLDDRAVFLARWHDLLLGVLTPARAAGDVRRVALRRAVRFWGGRASIDSVGFRVVREFRLRVRAAVLTALTAPCFRADRRFRIHRLNANVEDSVWRLVTERPPHLLPPRYPSWEGLMLDQIDAIGREVAVHGESFEDSLAGWTWGEANRARIRHPLSGALGPLADWLELDMPAERLPGDTSAMPRIQGRSDGASERFAVSPGREAEGYLHIPGGQSGHPLSPHYRDQQDAWARGRATPFLPGPAVHTLRLVPR